MADYTNIKSRPLDPKADENWDRIFGKRKKENECQEMQTSTCVPLNNLEKQNLEPQKVSNHTEVSTTQTELFQGSLEQS